ncbi:MAG: hypothetical protein BJ554DRAFT_5207 [Olpidium bornovanus]|uniref:DUF5672 domain-containing protein n=1 Tax=Olpidium bornovanus TaxID=278681 RepID=A0A8H8DEY2_9FUNG|nr:MAG: hypothetical protein BJ554DRAFT_5207 [Olpidium bornovanus]
MTESWLWSQIQQENDFFEYDYVGPSGSVPLPASGAPGTGGLSIRKRSHSLRCLREQPPEAGAAEDVYFSTTLPSVGGRVAPRDVSAMLVAEAELDAEPLGVHRPWAYSLPVAKLAKLYEPPKPTYAGRQAAAPANLAGTPAPGPYMAADTALRDLLRRLERAPAEGRAPFSQQQDALLEAIAGDLETAVDALDVGRGCPESKQAAALLDGPRRCARDSLPSRHGLDFGVSAILTQHRACGQLFRRADLAHHSTRVLSRLATREHAEGEAFLEFCAACASQIRETAPNAVRFAEEAILTGNLSRIAEICGVSPASA